MLTTRQKSHKWPYDCQGVQSIGHFAYQLRDSTIELQRFSVLENGHKTDIGGSFDSPKKRLIQSGAVPSSEQLWLDTSLLL